MKNHENLHITVTLVESVLQEYKMVILYMVDVYVF